MNEILDSLKVNKSTKEKPITHTLINGGKYHVPKNQLKRFYKKINKNCIDNGEKIQLVEKMGDYHPFVIDIDIKYNNELNQREYNDVTVKEIITFAWGKLSDLLDLSDQSRFGEIWVMEKEQPYPC